MNNKVKKKEPIVCIMTKHSIEIITDDIQTPSIQNYSAWKKPLHAEETTQTSTTEGIIKSDGRPDSKQTSTQQLYSTWKTSNPVDART